MKSDTNYNILTAFEIYKEVIFGVDVDLRFWQSFLDLSIREYKMKNPKIEEVFTAIFPAYNINPHTNHGLLKTDNKILSIKTKDLDKHSQDFFVWVSNLSILKTYNALEIFLLQAIQLKYFPEIKNPIENKKATNQITDKIKSYLKSKDIKVDTKNNRYIIQFLKQKSTDITIFLEQPVRFNLTTNWENFFELISILRNVIAHNGIIVSADILCEINSKAKDIFNRHFSLSKNNKYYMILSPITDQFLEFISFYNDFALNSVKLMYNESELTIFKMN